MHNKGKGRIIIVHSPLCASQALLLCSLFSSNPQDCSQVKCRKGFIFGSRHARPRCVNQKPLPKTCSDLDCHSLNMSCHQTNKSPQCFVAGHCHELACAKDEYCSLTTYPSRNLTIAERVKQTTQHCDSHSSNPCVKDQMCMSVT